MKKLIKIGLLMGLILRGGIFLSAQTTLQVVSKNVDKLLDFKTGNSLEINVEKADLVVKSWTSPQVKIQVELLAKHPQLETAKKDLNALKFVAETIGKTMYIRNYVAIEKGQPKPTADLRAIITVWLPAETPIYIKNSFGKTNVQQFNGHVDLSLEFCKTKLSQLKGEVTINTRFGDVEADNLNGKLTITSNRSNLTLKILRGPTLINATYGKIIVEADRNLTTLTVNGDKADVDIFNPKNATINYTLSADYGTISTPKSLNFNYLENSKNRKRANLQGLASASKIAISTSFGSILIQ
jgi:Putative adhesin